MYDDYEEDEVPGDLPVGYVTTLTEYSKPIRLPKQKHRVRMGFQPPHRAWLKNKEKG